MSEFEGNSRNYSGALLATIAIALAASIGGLIWCATINSHLNTTQIQLANALQQDTDLAAKLRETNARLTVATDELGKSLGLTQKQLDQRAAELVRREQAAEESTKQLQAGLQQTAQQVTAVSSEVGNVKTAVGGVRSDLGKTQTDLAATIAQLASVRGDLSSTNSVIARNHDELVTLEHKGDRNYYEFTLNKGERKPVGTVSLELKKTDQKKSKFTVNVYADDKTYEKKDRSVNEPMQFYSGKTPALYEVVVNSINNKNQISGYLSTPK